jgi:hypothetical protein
MQVYFLSGEYYAEFFNQDLPGIIGVGDALQYDADDNGSIDSLAILQARVHARLFKVVAPDAGTLSVSGGISDYEWKIFRAYISLSDAENGTENPALDDTVEHFEIFSGGRDLPANNEQWNLACYQDSVDTVSVIVNGWTTDSNHTLRIYTPVESFEVGISQRHQGFPGSGYQLKVNNATALTDFNANLTLEGLEIHAANALANGRYAVAISGAEHKDIRISACLIHGSANQVGFADHHGIRFWSEATRFSAGKVWLRFQP